MNKNYRVVHLAPHWLTGKPHQYMFQPMTLAEATAKMQEMAKKNIMAWIEKIGEN